MTVGLEAPACFSSSATMADLSAAVRVGVLRMLASLVSLLTRLLRAFRALAVGSRDDDLVAAVY